MSASAVSEAARVPAAAARGRLRAAVVAAAGVLAAIPYLLLASGPLRLTDDGVVYLSMARSLLTGVPYRPPAVDFPRGYPALLAGLQWLGIDRVWTFVLLNDALVALGLLCAYALLRRALGLGRTAALAVCVAVLVAHDLVSITPTPSSDPAFFGVALLTVLLVERSTAAPPRHALLLLGAACALAAAGVELRSIGVALLAPVAVGVLRRPRVRTALARARGRVVLAGAAAATVAGAAFAVAGTGYGGRVRAGWDTSGGAGAVARALPRQLHAKLDVIGTVSANIAPDHWPAALAWAMPVAGAAAVVLVALGLARRRRFGPAEAFFAGAVVVLAVWPENSSRLLIPLLPLAAGWMVVALRSLWRRRTVRAVATAWAAAFVAAGCASLVHGVLLDHAGAAFPHRWKEDRPALTAAYEIAYGELSPHAGVPYDRDALRLLRRYPQAIPGGAR